MKENSKLVTLTRKLRRGEKIANIIEDDQTTEDEEENTAESADRSNSITDLRKLLDTRTFNENYANMMNLMRHFRFQIESTQTHSSRLRKVDNVQLVLAHYCCAHKKDLTPEMIYKEIYEILNEGRRLLKKISSAEHSNENVTWVQGVEQLLCKMERSTP